MMSEFFRDLRFGARLLRRSAGFTSVAVLSLGSGIGGATAVFSLVNAIVLRTLPVPDPQQLFQARSLAPGREYGDLFSAPTFEHARDELSARGAGELFAATSVAGMQLQSDGEAIGARGNVQLVSGEYFTALRQHAQLGRLLAPSDNRAVGGASGRRHQRRLLAAALRRRARRRRPAAGDQRDQLHGDRRHPPAFLRHDAVAARARTRGSRT